MPRGLSPPRGIASLFGIAFTLRGARTAAVAPGVLALEVAGAALIGVTGWFGGHLVFGHGVGVDAARDGKR